MVAPEVEIEKLVAGGHGLARAADGRVVFVPDVVPGDRVRLEVSQQRRDFLRGRMTRLVSPGSARVEPPCPYVTEGCGGCDWQHVDAARQPGLRRAIVEESLRRQHLPHVAIGAGPDLPSEGHRTTLRLLAVGSRLAFRERASHRGVVVDHCLVAHPLAAELLDMGVAGADEVTLRVAPSTGERMVILHPRGSVTGLPGDVRVVTDEELDHGAEAAIHEEVAGRRFRISARSFFQTTSVGAEALVGMVLDAAGELGGARLLDLYGGVGLFAATVGEAAAQISMVESSASSVGDARVNLGPDATVEHSEVERWKPRPADVVVADPPRKGLQRAAVTVVAETGADRVVLVSCDAAAFARDARLLTGEGYRLDQVTAVDLFPHTSHVEIVSAFRRTT